VRRLALAAAFVALALAGCGDGESDEPGGGTTEPATTQSDPYDY
jgi:hypothetical protein